MLPEHRAWIRVGSSEETEQLVRSVVEAWGLRMPPIYRSYYGPPSMLGCSGDLTSRLSNRPYGPCCGLLCGRIGATKWTY